MILLIDRLNQFDLFSDSEKLIATYILDNPHQTTNMTIHELSEATFSSPATITRFCRKIKTEGFTEFKILLATELSTLNITKTRIEDNIPFSKQDSPNEIIKRIFNLNIQSLMDTYNNLDKETLISVASMIRNCTQIHIFGSGQSLLIAQDFQYKLMRIGINVSVDPLSGFQVMRSLSQPVDSLAFIISYYGSNKETLTIAEALKSRNIPTVLLTGPTKNPISDLVDTVIQVPPQEELIRKMATYSSRAAMQLIIDLLFALIFSLDYDDNQKTLEIVSK